MSLPLGLAAGFVAGAAVLAACSPTPTPSQSPTSGSATPSASPRPSIARTEFTAAYAAGTLDAYLKALGSKDVATICALNASVAPGNPQKQSVAECFSAYQWDIEHGTDYWKTGELDKWAGMTAVASRAVVNEKDNFVFDSNQGGFEYKNGKPADCAAKSGCWFVVLYDAEGVYVSRGRDTVYYQ